MAGNRGRYYVRKSNEAGRVVSLYLGSGTPGQAAAAVDAEERAVREAAAAAWPRGKGRWEALTPN